ncbi:hypothetical protein ACRRTK_006623 [Alexandromys fortis]
MMQPQVFISGLILLLPGAVDSYELVKGVVGYPVTLPCTYSTRGGIFTTCWGQGACPSSHCTNTLIWTNGYRVTYQRSSRYQLKGNISGGNVSLIIENAVPSDSGLYCCRVEVPGWFNDLKVTFSLEIKPDWNNTVISSDDSWNTYTELIPSGKAQKNVTSGFYISIPIAVLLLLLLVSTVAITRYICTRNKSQSLSLAAFHFSKIGALQNTVVFRSRAEDNVYIIEDSPYPTD